MSAADDLMILNQAKALEGMRQRLKSHMRKLTERTHMVNKMEQMIARRDDEIHRLTFNKDHLLGELKKALAENTEMMKHGRILADTVEALQKDRPEGYDLKCQELEKLKAVIAAMQDIFLCLGMKVTPV